jgi:outer membrane protein assembly factor BamB
MNASCSSLQALYFHGSWNTVCGTSEVAPELAGLFAQFNAYALATGSICGSSGTSPCEPLGLATPIIWHQGIVGDYSPHNPFYDITTGNNDAGTGTGMYPAKVGYDLATGWGSINALQLYRLFAWHNTPDYHGPTVTFDGPPLGKWYNYNAKVSWTITEPLQPPDLVSAGISGFSSVWDRIPSDPTSEPAPGCCNAFWNGPEFPLLTTGSLGLADLGQQGCHTANVQAWDNLGRPSYPANYGVICYDTIVPSISSHSFSPGSPSHAQTVTIKATATDPGCGTTGSCVGHIEYWVNTAADGSNNGAWVHIGSSPGASGSAGWLTGKQFNTGFLKATWDAGRHLIATNPWDNAGNAGDCVPPHLTNTCATYLLDRPDWPQYRQNARHTGANPFEHGLTAGNVGRLKRACALSGHGVLSGVAIYNGVAYAGSSNGKVYAVDSRCKIKWAFTTGGAVRGTLDVTDAVAYVGSSDGKVYALNLQDGTMKWQHATGGAVTSSPVVANGVVYVGSDDRHLYALNQSNGIVRWSYSTQGAVKSSPAVDAAGEILFGSDDHTLYVLNGSGTLKWKIKTGGAIRSSPAVDGGMVFVGSDDRKVYVRKVSNGAKVWTFVTGGKVVSSPAVSGGRVVIGSQDGKVFALGERLGQVVWTLAAGKPVSSDAAVANGIVYLSIPNKVLALRIFDGHQLFASAAAGNVLVSVGNGRLYATGVRLTIYRPT